MSPQHPPYVSLTRAGDSAARTVPACVPALICSPMLQAGSSSERARGKEHRHLALQGGQQKDSLQAAALKQPMVSTRTVTVIQLVYYRVRVLCREVPSAQYTKQTSNRTLVETTLPDASWYRSGHLWTVKLTGLQPATNYSYRVDNSQEAGIATRCGARRMAWSEIR